MKTVHSIKIMIGVTLAVIFASYVINVAGQTGREASSSEAGCTKKYDRFRNRNTVTVEPRTIYRAGTDELKLGASIVAEGDQGTARERLICFSIRRPAGCVTATARKCASSLTESVPKVARLTRLAGRRCSR